MSDLPLVSIIVPSFNYGHLIADTLNDILKQTYKNWECLIVDDGSSDNTKWVVDEFVKNDNRFKYFFQDNQGLSAARNTGLKNCKGDLIQLLDSDDQLEKNKLTVHVNELIQNPTIDIVYSSVRYFTTENPTLRLYDMKTIKAKSTWMPCVSGTGIDILKHLVKGNIMVVNSPIFRRKIIDLIGYFDVDLRALEDWDYWVRCALQNINFKYVNGTETSALVRSHLISMTKDNHRMHQANIKFRLKFDKLLSASKRDDCEKIKIINTKELHKLYSEEACEFIRNGEVQLGWKKLCEMSSKTNYPWVYHENGIIQTRKYFKKKIIQFFK
jgi:glycosyltransferase involved in cell wall biosynthesis